MKRLASAATAASVNRDRACGGGLDADSCSGISRQPYDFTKIVAQYQG